MAQQQDLEVARMVSPEVTHVLARASVAFGYELVRSNTDGSLQWTRQQLEGPLYVARSPTGVSLLVHNRKSPDNLVEPLHPGIRHELKEQFLMWRNTCSDVHGKALWFPKAAEAQTVHAIITSLCSTSDNPPVTPPPSVDGALNGSVESQHLEITKQPQTPRSISLSRLFPDRDTPTPTNPSNVSASPDEAPQSSRGNASPPSARSAGNRPESMHAQAGSSAVHVTNGEQAPADTLSRDKGNDNAKTQSPGTAQEILEPSTIARAVQSAVADQRFHQLLTEHLTHVMRMEGSSTPHKRSSM